MGTSNHIWQFSSVGGVKRVNLESGKDLLALDSLDQKLWTALSCPVEGLEIDSKTLELIDLDKDGRIRVPEILQAVKWLTGLIKNPDDILKQEKKLPLSYINTANEEGKNLYASAKQILQNLDLPDATHISIEQTSDITKIFAKTNFNGDGIITTESTDDKVLKKLIQQIIDTIGSQKDRSGKKGVNEELVEAFYKNCEEYSAWHTKAEANLATVLPFGDNTQNAMDACEAVKSKVEDFYMRCRLAEFDTESTNALNNLVTRIEAISPKDLSSCLDEIATYPLAKININQNLPLIKGINPAWKLRFENFVSAAVKPVFAGNSELKEDEWKSLVKKFDAYVAWKSVKAGANVEILGLGVVREILSSSGKEALLKLIKEDKALEKEADNIIKVDQLVRYYADLFCLLRNFVTFYDFYSPDEKAIFQNGTLFIDQRSCDLCITVSDMDKHNTMVSLSGMYLIYCDCVSRHKNEKMTIVAAMTNGDVDNLMVGRNAVFYDRSGMDWDATITKIVENPISIRQAFWSPYRKVARFIEAQIEKFAADKEKESMDKMTAGVEETGTKATTAAPQPKEPPQPFDIGKFVGIFAALSLALGAIGGVLASFISGFLQLVWWQMPIALVGIMLTISGPSMLIAWLKLRKRNLAPILDANGWAINARAIINIPFGNTLTHLVKLPDNAKVNLNDPFKKKKNPLITLLWILLVTLILVTCFLWKYGYLSTWLDGSK